MNAFILRNPSLLLHAIRYFYDAIVGIRRVAGWERGSSSFVLNCASHWFSFVVTKNSQLLFYPDDVFLGKNQKNSSFKIEFQIYNIHFSHKMFQKSFLSFDWIWLFQETEWRWCGICGVLVLQKYLCQSYQCSSIRTFTKWHRHSAQSIGHTKSI